MTSAFFCLATLQEVHQVPNKTINIKMIEHKIRNMIRCVANNMEALI